MSDDINFGEIFESLNDKSDRDGSNVPSDSLLALKEYVTNSINSKVAEILSGMDYVVESKEPTDSDYSWYRKYKSGWIEQGGRITGNNTDGSVVIPLLKQMKNTNYSINVFPCMATNTGTASNMGASRSAGCYDKNSITTTSFSAQKQGTQSDVIWEVKGQGA